MYGRPEHYIEWLTLDYESATSPDYAHIGWVLVARNRPSEEDDTDSDDDTEESAQRETAHPIRRESDTCEEYCWPQTSSESHSSHSTHEAQPKSERCYFILL
jgi:hypothetical protein